MTSSLQIQRITPINLAASTALQVDFDKNQSNPMWVCRVPGEIPIPDDLLRHHTHRVSPKQCCSAVVQEVDAPIASVWSVVRRFDNPQAYKQFLKSCRVVHGGGEVGTIHEAPSFAGYRTVVVESYVVDVPAGNTREETCAFSRIFYLDRPIELDGPD